MLVDDHIEMSLFRNIYYKHIKHRNVSRLLCFLREFSLLISGFFYDIKQDCYLVYDLRKEFVFEKRNEMR